MQAFANSKGMESAGQKARYIAPGMTSHMDVSVPVPVPSSSESRAVAVLAKS